MTARPLSSLLTRPARARRPEPCFTTADVFAIYAFSADSRKHCDVSCGYCDSKLERVVVETAAAWFVKHPCVSPYAGRTAPADLSETRRLQRRRRVLEHNLVFTFLRHLTDVPSVASLEGVSSMSGPNATQYGVTWHGGHRHWNEKPTAERLEHEAHIDRLLARILGRPVPPAPVASLPVVTPTVSAVSKIAA